MSVGAVNKQTGDRIPTAGMPAIDDELDLTSVNPVQNAIVTAALALKQDKTDNALQTTDKTVVGAVNELKSGLTNLSEEVNGDATTYPYADVITVEDAVPANLADCSVKVEPVQDLHGYDKPWVGGAGKNKLDISTITLAVEKGFTASKDDSTGLITIAGTYTGTAAGYGFFLFTTTYIPDTKVVMIDESVSMQGNSLYWDGTTGRVVCNLYNLVQGQSYNFTFKLMIVDNSLTPTSYEPYSNICPISGHTEAKVDRVGKNRLLLTLADIKSANTSGTWANNVYTISNCTFTVNTDADGKVISITAANAATVSSYVLLNIPMPKDDNNYLFNGGASSNYEIFIWDKTTSARAKKWDGITNSVTSTGSDFNEVKNVKDHNLLLVCRIGTNSPAGSGTFYPMVCPSFTTDPTYEPYAGQQYTLALGDTIYGCTVDFDSGVMVVDRASVDMDTLTYTYDDTYHRFATNSLTNIKQTTQRTLPMVCECYDVIDDGREFANVPPFAIYNGNDVITVYIHDSRYTSPSDLATALDGMKLVYPIATPFTVQLTPTQIQLLQGQNTLYASTGDISVSVNGVAGSIGAVQEQANELAEEVEEIKPVDYSTTEQKTGQKWIDGKDIYFNTFELTEPIEISNSAWTSLGISATGIDTLINAVLHFSPTGIRNTEVRVDGGVVKAIASRTGTFEVSCVILYYTKATT